MGNDEIKSSEESISAILSKRLGLAMKALNETKSSLARKTDLSEATIRGYLKGSSSAGVEQLMKISRATGIRVAWYIGEQDDMYGEGITIEEELSLLTMLFRHLPPVQRQIVLSQVLAALAEQYNCSNGVTDIRKLSSSVINTAIKINELSDAQLNELGANLIPKILPPN